MKSILLAGVALVLSTAAVAPLAAKPAASKPAAKPQLGDFGVDLTAMDKTVAPGDDFYRYVNGGWMDRTEIPADRASWGGFAILRDLSDQRTRIIIEDAAKVQNAPGSIGEKIGVTYAGFMDAAAIEAKGAAPLKPYLDEIVAIATPTDLARYFAKSIRRGVSTPIGMGVGQDRTDNSKYTVYAGQGGLGMPDRDYYLKDDAKSVEVRAKYLAHIAALMKLAGQPDPDGAASRIFAFEKSIAEVHWTRTELRVVEKTFNPFPATALPTKFPGFDWAAMMDATGLSAQPIVIVAQPSAMTGTAKILAGTPMPVIHEYLAFQTIKSAAPLLSKAFVDESFAFTGTVLQGTPQLKDRWKRGVDLVNGSLGEAVGQVYVDRYFPPAAKAKADELVRNLIAAMDIRLSNLT